MVQQLPRSANSAKTAKVVVVAGATASGKSALAIEIAKRYPSLRPYIVNADSRQVYKDFQIGTAAPIPDEIRGDAWIVDGVEHYLYGYVEPTRRFTVADFKRDLEDLVFRDEFRDRLAIVVGGTGLYIDNFVYNLIAQSGEENSELRARLNSMSLVELQGLAGKELDLLNESDRANPRRLIRLIERKEAGRLEGESPRKIRDDIELLYLYLDIPKEELNRRIEIRTAEMVQLGLRAENERLRSAYGDENAIINSTISYKEFNNSASDAEIIEQISLHNRQYAKKQRTWFKKNIDLTRIQNLTEAVELIEQRFCRI